MSSETAANNGSGMEKGTEDTASLVRVMRNVRHIPWVPHRRSKLALWFGRRADWTLREFIGHIRPTPPPGRPERFAWLVRRSFQDRLLGLVARRAGGVDVRVEFLQAFGKPMMVNFDISVTRDHYEQMEAALLTDGKEEESRNAYRVFVQDILDLGARALWDNPEIAPVALRGRIVIEPDGDGEVEVLHDLRDLGFVDEIARPEDCFRRYGPPASDPTWKP